MDIQKESRLIKELYDERFTSRRNPKSGKALKDSAIRKYKILAEKFE